MQEQNTIQTIKKTEEEATLKIEKEKANAVEMVKKTEEKNAREKEKIIRDFDGKTNNMEGLLKQETEKMQKNARENLRKKVVELEKVADKNFDKSAEFIKKELLAQKC